MESPCDKQEGVKETGIASPETTATSQPDQCNNTHQIKSNYDEKCAEMSNKHYESGSGKETVVDAGQSYFHCQSCNVKSTSTIATIFCETCKEYQCQNCLYGHMTNLSGSHVLKLLEVARNKSPIADLEGLDKCDTHKEYLRFFCKDDDEICCSTCAFNSHRNCKYVIEIIACPAEECLNEKEKLIELKEKNSSTISYLDTVAKDIEKQKEDIVKELDSMRTRIIQRVDQFSTDIMEAFNTIQNRKVQEFETITSKCTSLHQSLTSEIDFVNKVDQYGTYLQKFVITHRLKKRFTDYHNTAYELESNIVKTNMMLVLEKTLDILANSTLELGSLKVSEAKSRNTVKDMKESSPSYSTVNDNMHNERMASDQTSAEKKDIHTQPKELATQAASKSAAVQLNVHQGELEKIQADVLVTLISSSLDLKDGDVSHSLLQVAGKKLQEELHKECSRNPLKVGKVLKTEAYNIHQSKFIFFGMVFQKTIGGSTEHIKEFVLKCLSMAISEKCKSIAFPALGTGLLGFSADEIAEVMFTAVNEFTLTKPILDKVVFVIHPKKKEIYKEFLEREKRNTQSS